AWPGLRRPGGRGEGAGRGAGGGVQPFRLPVHAPRRRRDPADRHRVRERRHAHQPRRPRPACGGRGTAAGRGAPGLEGIARARRRPGGARLRLHRPGRAARRARGTGAGAARRRSRSHAGCGRGARTGGIAGDLSRRRAGAPRAGAAGASADRGPAPEPASGRRRHGRSPGRRDGEGKQRRLDRVPAGERDHPGGAGLRLDRVGLRRHSRARRGPGEGGGRMSATNTAMLLSDWTSPLYGWLMSLGAIGVIIWIVLKVLVIMMPVIIAVAFYVVWERKLIGWMHALHGPMYVGWGVLQAFADVFKLLFKEVIQPTNAQKTLYILAPLITLAPAFAAWAVVPFDAQLVLSDAN